MSRDVGPVHEGEPATFAGTSRPNELKKFLRARRAELPIDAAPNVSGRRRIPGLRREEVAALAGVSVTWYTWLEQGRDIHCSIDLLNRLARALRLSETDIDYLFRLAGYPAPMNRESTEMDSRVQFVLDAFAGPAFILNPRLDVIAFNALGDLVFDFLGHSGEFGTNHLWRGFMDPARKALYADWPRLMANAVAFLRGSYATRIGDQEFERLITTLVSSSPDFDRMWEQHRTFPLSSVEVSLRHLRLGPLEFISSRFGLPTLNDHIAFFLACANRPTSKALKVRPT